MLKGTRRQILLSQRPSQDNLCSLLQAETRMFGFEWIVTSTKSGHLRMQPLTRSFSTHFLCSSGPVSRLYMVVKFGRRDIAPL